MTTYFDLDEDEEARARRLHEDSLVIDGLVTRSYLREDEYRAHLSEGGLTAANITVASRTNFHEATRLVQQCRRTIRDNPEELSLVLEPEDVAAAKRDGTLGLIVGFQDSMPMEPTENMTIENPLEVVDAFEQMGVRIVQLTYNYLNRAGAGCCERGDPGLSYFGRDLVDAMNRSGIVVDVSHCGDRTTTEAIEYSDDPVLVSHAGLRSRSNLGRNKTDEHLRAVADGGGVFGITFFPPSVKSDPDTHEVQESTVHDVLDQIDYAVDAVGIDHVGFGSDMNDYWLAQDEPAEHGVNRNFRPRHPEVYGRGPTDALDPYPQGIHRHTKLPNLTRGLVSRGYTDAEIEKLLGGNYIRLLTEVRSR